MPDGQFIDLEGPVHYVDHGGTGPVMVLVHGLGGSHVNWVDVAPRLAERFHVYAIDLAGFGLTPPAGRRSTVQANQGLLHDFCEAVSPDEPVVLVGNSMGGLIVTLEAAAHPDRVAGAVLVDPALPLVDPAALNVFTMQRLFIPLLPFVGTLAMRRYFSRASAEQQLSQTLVAVCADPSVVSEASRAASLAMIERRNRMPWRLSAFLDANRSIAATLARRSRFESLVDAITCPVLLIHGSEDRIVSPGSARWLAERRPEWTFEMLDGIGHVPQLEVPELFVDLVEEFLERAGTAS